MQATTSKISKMSDRFEGAIIKAPAGHPFENKPFQVRTVTTEEDGTVVLDLVGTDEPAVLPISDEVFVQMISY